MWETQVRSLGWEDPLEKEMATNSSTLALKIPWMEELGTGYYPCLFFVFCFLLGPRVCCSAVIWSAAYVSGSVSSVFAQIWETKTRGGHNQFEGSRERLFSAPPTIGIREGGVEADAGVGGARDLI